jgi:hypothetical protein
VRVRKTLSGGAIISAVAAVGLVVVPPAASASTPVGCFLDGSATYSECSYSNGIDTVVLDVHRTLAEQQLRDMPRCIETWDTAVQGWREFRRTAQRGYIYQMCARWTSIFGWRYQNDNGCSGWIANP